MGDEKIPSPEEIKKFLSDRGATMTVVFSTEDKGISEELDDTMDDDFASSVGAETTDDSFDDFIKKHGDARIS